MTTKKSKTKRPEQSGPLLDRWEVLKLWGETKNSSYITALCTAIELGESIPSAALLPLKKALEHLLGHGPIRPKTDAFARELGLVTTRGRPKSEVNYFRAAFYWYVRNLEGVGHTEAIAIVADEYENCDESIVAKAVRAHPEAESMGNAMVKLAREEAAGGK